MKKTIYQGQKIRVTLDNVALPDGTRHTREMVEHPGAVVVLPLLDDGRVVLERHYRACIGAALLELPAGTLEADEDPCECAGRELTEETGLVAKEIVHLATFYTSPGVLTEKMHCYLARGLSRGRPALEAGEVITPVEMPFAEVLEMAATGRIEDVKTIAAIFIADSFLERERGEGA